ncbi:MAG: EscR/YscR/HrcR family type III secretion system export apparatus protein [Pseudomonadota bacterium]
MENLATPLVLGFIAGFFLLAVLSLTAFVKISVVLMVVRQGLGLQQVPSNVILLALALFLSIFISAPIFSASLNAVAESGLELDTAQSLFDLWNVAAAPFQSFMVQKIDPAHAELFVASADRLWTGSGLTASLDEFAIQVPAFMISELTEAFRIGFLLYLPFIAIDLAVTGILMALGMQMVQPNIIAVPFKLLLFVFVDGWARLAEGLLAGYSAV